MLRRPEPVELTSARFLTSASLRWVLRNRAYTPWYLLPALFWAMLGVARRPQPGSTIRGFSDQRVTAWQFATGTDTVEYVLERGTPTRLLAEVRQAGSRLGRVETRFGPDGFPATSRLTVEKPRSRLDLTVQQHTKVASFAADTWLRPAAQP